MRVHQKTASRRSGGIFMSTGHITAAIALAASCTLAPVPGALTGPANATIIEVPADEPTITAGILAASPGDTVLLAPGSYTESFYYYGKSVVVGSRYLTTGDEGAISSTVIDGQGSVGPLARFESGEDSLAMLVGLTLRDGVAMDGGAVYCESSSPRISKCVFESNEASRYGGAVCGWDASPIIEDCRFEFNSVAGIAGGAVQLRYGSPRFESCLFWGNTSHGEGGAMSLQDASPVIRDCIIESNTATTHYAGGVICRNCTAVIRGSVFTANVSGWTGGGLFY